MPTHSRGCLLLLVKNRFSAANLPYLDRSGWNLAEICCCTIGYTLVGLISPWSVHGRLQAKRWGLRFFVIPKMYHKSSNIQRNSALSFIHNFGSLSCFWQLRPMIPTTTRTSTVPLDPAEISPPRSSCVFMMLHGHRGDIESSFSEGSGWWYV